MIIAVVGPTGIGKTKLSILLAKKYNAIVVNCDAMQVYKEMNIGTAKIKENEKEGIKHFLFGIKSITENYSVYDYQKDLRNIIDSNLNNNVIIVGGTGLYLKAGLFDYHFDKHKELLTFDNYSNEELYELVKKEDPNTQIHLNNRRRLINYLNINHLPQKKNNQLYEAIFIGLTMDREKLYQIIEERVDQQINNGLMIEVKSLFDQGINTIPINTAIGYKELYQYFYGNISLDDAIALIKKNTRHYVKKQYTWFNNQMNIKWFESNINDFAITYNDVINYIDTLDK